MLRCSAWLVWSLRPLPGRSAARPAPRRARRPGGDRAASVRLATCTPWKPHGPVVSIGRSLRGKGGMMTDTAGAAASTPAAGGYLYRALAEHLPDVAVFLFDQDLRFKLATGAGLAKSAWRTEEIIGRTVQELFPPERAEPPRPRLGGGRGAHARPGRRGYRRDGGRPRRAREAPGRAGAAAAPRPPV